MQNAEEFNNTVHAHSFLPHASFISTTQLTALFFTV